MLFYFIILPLYLDGGRNLILLALHHFNDTVGGGQRSYRGFEAQRVKGDPERDPYVFI